LKTRLWPSQDDAVESQVLNTQTEEEQVGVPKMRATVMEFHQMLGHLAFEKILKLAKDPRYGLEISAVS
jgi:hypothetical protein